MTLFASKRGATGLFGEEGKVFYLERLEHGWLRGHGWPKAGGPRQPPTAYDLVLSLQGFISPPLSTPHPFLLPISDLSSPTYSCYPFLPMCSDCFPCLLAALAESDGDAGAE